MLYSQITRLLFPRVVEGPVLTRHAPPPVSLFSRPLLPRPFQQPLENHGNMHRAKNSRGLITKTAVKRDATTFPVILIPRLVIFLANLLTRIIILSFTIQSFSQRECVDSIAVDSDSFQTWKNGNAGSVNRKDQ